MKVYFERSGGFAGMRMHIELDTDSLSPEEARALQERVSEFDFVNLPAEGTFPTRGADRFQYIAQAGGRRGCYSKRPCQRPSRQAFHPDAA